LGNKREKARIKNGDFRKTRALGFSEDF